jgi:hypothetical protein
MSNRRYQTTYTIAKFLEVGSWILLGGGIITGIFLLSKETTLGIGVILAAIFFGIIYVISAQFILVIVDIENNTRQAAEESVKTNAMLAETLGIIAANVNKIANKENKS